MDKTMQEKQPKLFVIEGTDGSGKETQTEILIKRIKQAKISVSTLDFPRYGNPSTHFVEAYLRGEYGTLDEVAPKQASHFYALDRYAWRGHILQLLGEGNSVILNRYVASNMAHQGSKIEDPVSRKDFFNWVLETEHNILEIPKPELNIVLRVPAEVAFKLVESKSKRDYLRGQNKDIHESDISHLRRTEDTYLELAKLYPDDFEIVECAPNGDLLSIDEIHRILWSVISPRL